MALDSSIFNRYKAADLMGSFNKGLEMREQMDERNKQKAISEAYQKGMTVGPDGKVSVNRDQTLAALAGIKGAGQEAYKAHGDFAAQDQAMQKANFDKQMQNLDFIGRGAASVKDQAGYQQLLSQAKEMGIPIESMPMQWGPEAQQKLAYYGQQALSRKDQLSNQLAERSAANAEANTQIARDNLGISRERLGIDRMKAESDAKKGSMNTATELRKERSTLPTTKATMEISAAYNKIQSAASKPSAAGDLSLVFNYMKMLDPGSVVREGEFKTAEQARAWMTRAESEGYSIPAPVKQSIQKLESGQFLLPEQRADFVNQAGGLYQAQMDIQNQVDSQFSALAQEAGVDPSKVILNFGANKPQAKKQEQSNQNSKPPVVMQGGVTYTLNPETGEYE